MEQKEINRTVDLAKLVMAVLVIGIHTEPFGFSIWLDRGFGMLTRLCVPFFFMASAYFCFKKAGNSVLGAVKRIGILYIVWSLIYLPFDIGDLARMSARDIILRFLWNGNEHALWYLCGSMIGLLIFSALLRVFKPGYVLAIGLALLVIGCAKSTWSPFFSAVLHTDIPNRLGYRNGLFYGFPYSALGMYMAKNTRWEKRNVKLDIAGFAVSLAALAGESVIFIFVYNTNTTILWLSVFPMAYFFFSLVSKIRIEIKKSSSLFLRRMSTLLYVSHGLFLLAFSGLRHMPYFIAVTVCSALLSAAVIYLSGKKRLGFLRYLY